MSSTRLWRSSGSTKAPWSDFAENVSVGLESWRVSYTLQAEQKQDQLEEIIRFAEAIIAG